MNQVRVKIEINDGPHGAVYETAATECDETVFDALSSVLAYCVGRTAQHLEGSPGVYVLVADVIESLAGASAQGCIEADSAMWTNERVLVHAASDLLEVAAGRESTKKEVVHVTEDAPATGA